MFSSPSLYPSFLSGGVVGNTYLRVFIFVHPTRYKRNDISTKKQKGIFFGMEICKPHAYACKSPTKVIGYFVMNAH